MENGDSINPGVIHDVYCEYGYPIAQGAIIIPHTLNDKVQTLFHLGIDVVQGLPDLPPTHLFYSTINDTMNSGLGVVVQKNHIIIQDTLCYGQLTAVRHADGSRWWAVIPENATNGYYIVLLDENEPQVYRKQHIGTVQDARDWAGQAVFSPDGRFYARADGYSGLEVMEFDRCHGAFYNPRHVELPLDEGALLGAAISPNSRYLYVNSQEVLLQYDLLANELAASVDTIGIYDGFESWLPATFYMMQLGPDGKIYMTTANGTNVLHVIQQPDEPGDACQFEQHALTLPTYYSFSPPNFPNYRLGPAPENYCDSITATVEPLPLEKGLKLLPNPASESLTIELPPTGSSFEIWIWDALGRRQAWLQSSSGSAKVDVAQWLPGIYFVVATSGGQYWQEKLLVH